MPEALEEAAGGSPLSWLALSLPYAAAAGVSAFAPQAVFSPDSLKMLCCIVPIIV
jgi:hypothetical protein